MPSPDERYKASHIERTVQFALFAVFATGVHALESLVTLPIPWLRIGFAHIVTMLMLPYFGAKFILGIFLIRVCVGSALVGKLFSPGFLLAFSGGLGATLVMLCVYRYFHEFLSFWGISLIGAFTHNLLQVTTASLVIHHSATFLLLPYFLALALATGTISGLLTNRIHAWQIS